MSGYSPAYYQKRKDDPEFKRKRKEYAQKRWARIAEQGKAGARAWAVANPERTREIDRASRQRNLMLHIYRNIKKRARARGMEFNIEPSDIVVPDVCPIFRVPFNMNATVDDCDFAPSVDRIDSDKGYIKGNVRVISRLANCMKWTATQDQLIAFAEGILRTHKK